MDIANQKAGSLIEADYRIVSFIGQSIQGQKQLHLSDEFGGHLP